jgi:hypothetical protein
MTLAYGEGLAVQGFYYYAILRYYHDAFTGEFLNIGVVVYSQEQRYLECRISRSRNRITKTFEDIGANHYQKMKYSIENAVNAISLLDFNKLPSDIESLLHQNIMPHDDGSTLRFGGYGGGVSQTGNLGADLNNLYFRLVNTYPK